MADTTEVALGVQTQYRILNDGGDSINSRLAGTNTLSQPETTMPRPRRNLDSRSSPAFFWTPSLFAISMGTHLDTLQLPLPPPGSHTSASLISFTTNNSLFLIFTCHTFLKLSCVPRELDYNGQPPWAHSALDWQKFSDALVLSGCM